MDNEKLLKALNEAIEFIEPPAEGVLLIETVSFKAIQLYELHRIADALEELVKVRYKAKVEVSGEMPRCNGKKEGEVKPKYHERPKKKYEFSI